MRPLHSFRDRVFGQGHVFLTMQESAAHGVRPRCPTLRVVRSRYGALRQRSTSDRARDANGHTEMHRRQRQCSERVPTGQAERLRWPLWDGQFNYRSTPTGRSTTARDTILLG